MRRIMKPHDLLERHGLFDAKVPRYTSYPPANRFGPDISPDTFAEWLGAIREGEAVSIYAHVPYCRRLCWFCACRTQGTMTDRPLGRYVEALGREIKMVRDFMPRQVSADRVHLGGGTPTILPPPLIADLMGQIEAAFPATATAEISAEVDPTEFDAARLEALARAGLSRASIGVQDFEPEIQAMIGRQQSFEVTREAVDLLRANGVGSINVDILYGLPSQTIATLDRTIDLVLDLSPDRVAAFGYAHVPWMSQRQTLIPEDKLPGTRERLALFDHMSWRFAEAGYVAIGIDHFARPTDSLALAYERQRLHRNFQGYTDDHSETLVGLGASAISRFREGHAQNQSATGRYLKAIGEETLATARGWRFSSRDRMIAEMIEELMCYGRVCANRVSRVADVDIGDVRERLVVLNGRFADATRLLPDGLEILPDARPLMRIIAAALDMAPAAEGRHSLAV